MLSPSYNPYQIEVSLSEGSTMLAFEIPKCVLVTQQIGTSTYFTREYQ